MNIQFNTPFINQNNIASQKIKAPKVYQENTAPYSKNLAYYYPQVSFRATTPDALKKIEKTSLKASSKLLEEWKLFDETALSKFITEHDNLKKVLGKALEELAQYRLKPNIQLFKKIQDHYPEIKSFFNILRTEYGMNFEESPKLYRFVGESEIAELLSGRTVCPQRYSNIFDTTINPDLNWNKYRITFKNTPEFSVWQTEAESKVKENPGINKEYYYHLKSTYSINDVEKIEIITPNGYEEVSL